MADEPREVQSDPVVMEGEDAAHLEPAPPVEPYTPEPGPRPGERRAFRVLALAFLALAIVVGLLIWVAVR
jgi:hypothetical protein